MDIKKKVDSKSISIALKDKCDLERAFILQGFFKTGPGEYAEGDIFVGVTVPEIRKIAKEYSDLDLYHTEILLESLIHEERMAALLILVDKFKKGEESEREKIFSLYLKNTKYINNWDLVDLTAPNIVGVFLEDKDKSILYKMAESKSLWDRRIAIMATFTFIRRNKYNDALKISKMLLADKEDLIHKAVGWMLREIGKRDMAVEEEFLKKHYKSMPRTMLRYAIEKFPEQKRQAYLKGNIA